MNQTIRTPAAPLPKGPYSQAVISGGFVFVAGQVALNPETNQFEYGTIESETERVFKNVRAILEAAGCGLRDVVRVGVFLKNLSEFAAMNEVYAKFFSENLPARTTVGADLPGVKIEVDCVAKLPEGK